MKRLLTLCLFLLAFGCFADRAIAAKNEGQADLDKATEKKLSAVTVDDLGEVINLCESALKKGLDPTNTQFANDLYTSTLLQRATFYTEHVTNTQFGDRGAAAKARTLALADLNKVVAKDAKAGAAWLMMAKLQELPGGDRAAAIKDADKAVELNKDDVAAEAASLMIRAGLLTDAKKRQADYDAAIKLTPSDPEALWGRAIFLDDEKKYKEALADIDTLLKIPSQAKRPQVHMARGMILYALKRNDEAKHAFDRAIELAPGSPIPFLERAKIRAEMKDNKGAIDDLTAVLQLDRNNIEVNIEVRERRAAIFAEEKKYDDAINDLEELNRMVPNNPKLNLQLGIFYMADKQSHKAIDKFTASLAVDNKNELAYLERGSAYLGLGKHSEAIHDYEAAIKLKPDDSELLNNFAWVLCTSPDAKLRDGKRALVMAKQAAELTKYKQAYILSTLAAAYAETGDFADATKWSTKAVEIGEKADKEELAKELASYKEKKPWRELHDEDAENAKAKDSKSSAADKTADKTAQKPATPPTTQTK